MMPHYFETVDGWFPFKAAFDTIVADLPKDRPSTVVEVGTWVGRSTAYLGVEIVNSGKPATLVAVDHFKGAAEITTERRVAMVPESEAIFRRNLAPVANALGDRFRVLVSDSAAAASAFADGSCDVVWIDAAHDYDSVSKDLDAWWPKVRPGGLFAGDDIKKCPGVTQAVTERFSPSAAVGKTCYWMVRRLDEGRWKPI